MFGEKLKEIRKRANLTQEEFADLFKVKRQNIIMWERAAYPPSDFVAKVCLYFNIPLWKFWGGDNLPILDLSPDEMEIIRMFRDVPDALHPLFVQLNAHTLTLLKETLKLIPEQKKTGR